jgi:multiple sugar transport system substrate-binding protein
MRGRGFAHTVVVSVLGLLLGLGVANHGAADPQRSISIIWWQGKPAEFLSQLARSFTAETGIEVTVRQVPWAEYADVVQGQIWARQSPDVDIVIGDSQWLGRGATQGHYVDLTEWAGKNVPWSEIFPSARKFYCEYNGRTYAVPCVGDAMGFAYRKDLFEDAHEKAAFREQYGYELAPPGTWAQFRDIAEFFTRPETGLYGAALYYGGLPAYDDVTMAFDQILWCFGGELCAPATGAVEGVINSPRAVEALEFFARELKKFTPPESLNYGIDTALEPFTRGRVAMAQNWYPFFPDLLDPRKDPYADRIGFFMSPAGQSGHFISLGGQPMSLSAYSTKKDLALTFLAWFSRTDTQRQWARLGGLTTHRSVLESAEFRSATPFNAAYADSVPLLRDFYNTPEYNELLLSAQRHLAAAVKGAEAPRQALDAIAREHTQVLRQSGRLP